MKNFVLRLFKLTNGYPLQTSLSGVATVFVLHRVVEKLSAFNRILEITPQRLEHVIQFLLRNNYKIVSIDYLYEVLINNKNENKLIVFTFDDGYADNFELAYPIFQKYNIPFTIFLTTDFADHKQNVWWYALEKIVLDNDFITISHLSKKLENKSHEQKLTNYNFLRNTIIGLELEEKMWLSYFFNDYLDLRQFSKKFFLNWHQIREMSNNKLVTIGAHSVSHKNLTLLTYRQALYEINESKTIIEKQIQKNVEHFAFPFGSIQEVNKQTIDIVKECGFKTAFTTITGNIFAEHKNHLYCLPRVFLCQDVNDFSLKMRLNGVYQYLTNKKKVVCI